MAPEAGQHDVAKGCSVTTAPDLLTPQEAIQYLRLDAEPGDANERLRNLIRRHRLPVLRRGRLKLFRKESIDGWLSGRSGSDRASRKQSAGTRSGT